MLATEAEADLINQQFANGTNKSTSDDNSAQNHNNDKQNTFRQGAIPVSRVRTCPDAVQDKPKITKSSNTSSTLPQTETDDVMNMHHQVTTTDGVIKSNDDESINNSNQQNNNNTNNNAKSRQAVLLSRFRTCPDSVRVKVTKLSNTADCKKFCSTDIFNNYSTAAEKPPVKNNFLATLMTNAKEQQQQFHQILGGPSSPSSLLPSPSPSSSPLSLLPIPQQLATVQKTLNSLEYSFLPIESFFDLRKRRSLRSILETAKDILTCSLPIRCLEAVFVAILLTSNMHKVSRFPISMTSCSSKQGKEDLLKTFSLENSNNDSSLLTSSSSSLTPIQYFKHIVLGVAANLQQSSSNNNNNNNKRVIGAPRDTTSNDKTTTTIMNFGTLGLSRRSCLMDKSITNYTSLSDLIFKDFASQLGYASVGHQLVSVRLGLPFSHNVLNRSIPCWTFVELFLLDDNNSDDSSKNNKDENEDDDGSDSLPHQTQQQQDVFHNKNNKKPISFSNHKKQTLLRELHEENKKVLSTFEKMMNVIAFDYLRFSEAYPECRGSCVRAVEKRMILFPDGGVGNSNNNINNKPTSSRHHQQSPYTSVPGSPVAPVVSPRSPSSSNNNNNNKRHFMSPTTTTASSSQQQQHHSQRHSEIDLLGKSLVENISQTFFSSHPKFKENRKLMTKILEISAEQQSQVPVYEDSSQNNNNNNAEGEGDATMIDDDGIAINDQQQKQEQLIKSFKENRFRIECLLRGFSPFKVAMGMMPEKNFGVGGGAVGVRGSPVITSSRNQNNNVKPNNIKKTVVMPKAKTTPDQDENELLSSSTPVEIPDDEEDHAHNDDDFSSLPPIINSKNQHHARRSSTSSSVSSSSYQQQNEKAKKMLIPTPPSSREQQKLGKENEQKMIDSCIRRRKQILKQIGLDGKYDNNNNTNNDDDDETLIVDDPRELEEQQRKRRSIFSSNNKDEQKTFSDAEGNDDDHDLKSRSSTANSTTRPSSTSCSETSSSAFYLEDGDGDENDDNEKRRKRKRKQEKIKRKIRRSSKVSIEDECESNKNNIKALLPSTTTEPAGSEVENDDDDGAIFLKGDNKKITETVSVDCSC